MTLHLAEEVMACLPKGRTLFPYSRNDFALRQLRYLLKEPTPIHVLKKSSLAPLLHNPAVRQLSAGLWNSTLDPSLIPPSQPIPPETTYRLGISRWGFGRRGWWGLMEQHSRPGFSLVLQLNLGKDVARRFRSCILNDADPFQVSCHPVRSGCHPTLAWCRIDLDFETGEVLIEEIQSDLVRDFRCLEKRAREFRSQGRAAFHFYDAKIGTSQFLEAWESRLKEQARVWPEAMLSAALEFITKELGIRDIYLHSHESGKKLKKIRGSGPPRSLYTDLPKRFCFSTTKNPPEFLSRYHRVKKLSEKEPLSFHRLCLAE